MAGTLEGHHYHDNDIHYDYDYDLIMLQGERVQQVAGILERQERGTSRQAIH